MKKKTYLGLEMRLLFLLSQILSLITSISPVVYVCIVDVVVTGHVWTHHGARHVTYFVVTFCTYNKTLVSNVKTQKKKKDSPSRFRCHLSCRVFHRPHWRWWCGGGRLLSWMHRDSGHGRGHVVVVMSWLWWSPVTFGRIMVAMVAVGVVGVVVSGSC